MIDILVYLFENYYEFPDHPKPEGLARKLSVVGFDDDEIAAALRWLTGLREARITEFSCDPRAQRVYSADEQRKLEGECLGFIAFLDGASLITPAVRELIVERAMSLDDRTVPLAKFRIIVLIVLWSRQAEIDVLFVEELLYADQPETVH